LFFSCGQLSYFIGVSLDGLFQAQLFFQLFLFKFLSFFSLDRLVLLNFLVISIDLNNTKLVLNIRLNIDF